MPITSEQYLAMLCRTEKNRGRDTPSANTPAEKEIEEIHEPILKWAREQVPFVPVIYHRPDIKSGLKRGVNDLTVFFRGEVFLLEGKSRTGKLSTEQIAWIIACGKQGFKVHVIHSAQDFFDMIKFSSPATGGS
jgi:hypothetical protein